MGTGFKPDQIQVVYLASAHAAHTVWVPYTPGLTIQTVLDRLPCPPFPAQPAAVGIFGRVQPLETVLSPGDRVEIYRPLQVDPKTARRLRAREQKRLGGTGMPPGRLP